MRKHAIPLTLAALFGAALVFPAMLLADGRSARLDVAKEAQLPGYKIEPQAQYSRVVTAADSTTGTAWVTTTNPTGSPPIVMCSGYQQVSLFGQAAVSTATVTLRPWYEDRNSNTTDANGPDLVWTSGPTVTIAAHGTTVPSGTSGYYGTTRSWVDTDGVGRMRFEVVEVTGGGAVRLFWRVN